MIKYGDAQPINVVRDLDEEELFQKNAEQQSQEILKLQEENDKQNKTER